MKAAKKAQPAVKKLRVKADDDGIEGGKQAVEAALSAPAELSRPRSRGDAIKQSNKQTARKT
jgi:hypothetical protein